MKKISIILLLGLAACSPKATQIQLDKNKGYQERGSNSFTAFGQTYDSNVRDITFLVFPEDEDLDGFQYELMETQLDTLYPFERVFGFTYPIQGFNCKLAGDRCDISEFALTQGPPQSFANLTDAKIFFRKMWLRIQGPYRSETVRNFLNEVSVDADDTLVKAWAEGPTALNKDAAFYILNLSVLYHGDERQELMDLLNELSSVKNRVDFALTNKDLGNSIAATRMIGHLGKSRDLSFEIAQAARYEVLGIEKKILALTKDVVCYPVIKSEEISGPNGKEYIKGCKWEADESTFDFTESLRKCADIEFRLDKNISPEHKQIVDQLRVECDNNYQVRWEELNRISKLYNDEIREATKGVVVHFFEKLKDHSGTQFLSVACTKSSKDPCVDITVVDKDASNGMKNAIMKFPCYELTKGKESGKCQVVASEDTLETPKFPVDCTDMKDLYREFTKNDRKTYRDDFKKNINVCRYYEKEATKEVPEYSQFVLSEDGQTVKDFMIRMEFLGGSSQTYSVANGGIRDLKLYVVDEAKQIINLDFTIEDERVRVDIESTLDFRDFYDLRFIGDADFTFADGRIRKGIFKMEVDLQP